MRAAHLALALALGAACTAAGLGEAPARSLKSPFAQAPSLPGADGPAVPCPPPDAPVRDIRIGNAFVPGDFTRIDPDRAKARREAVSPLHAFLGKVTKFSDAALRASGQPRREARACVERWLTTWAEADALFGEVSTPDGAYERKWALASLSLAYLKMYGADLPDAPPKPIADWLRRLAEQVVREYSGLAWKRNNHYYWAGLATAAAATAIDDPGLYAWGQRQYDLGRDAVDADGFLPLEIARGPLALYYHAFSASALATLCAFRAANGAAGDEPALRRLVDRILGGLSDPTPFEARAGAGQVWEGGIDGRVLAWLEAYRGVIDDPASEPWIAAFRPLGTIWLGGDMTRALGRPLAPQTGIRSPFAAR